jgi:membrane protease YdiL (CAAX protease family)
MESYPPSSIQRSIRFLIILHLFPGIILLLGIIVFSQPLVYNIFGIHPKFGPLFGYVIATPLLLIELGWLFYEGRQENSNFSLKGIINYTDRSSLWYYIVAGSLLLIYTLIMFVLIAPILQPFIIDTFFPWWPQEYNFQNALHDPMQLKGNTGDQLFAVLYFIFPATTIATVEELYFRGYLLPQLDHHIKQYSPLVNSVLFSIYHFYSPWENPIRIIALLPVIYLVWYKKDIRFAILTHVIANFLGGIVILFIAFS